PTAKRAAGAMTPLSFVIELIEGIALLSLGGVATVVIERRIPGSLVARRFVFAAAFCVLGLVGALPAALGEAATFADIRVACVTLASMVGGPPAGIAAALVLALAPVLADVAAAEGGTTAVSLAIAALSTILLRRYKRSIDFRDVAICAAIGAGSLAVAGLASLALAGAPLAGGSWALSLLTSALGT